MRLAIISPSAVSRPTPSGPLCIGIGLCLLFANAWLPTVPAVTAVALVALGATAVAVDRFSDKPGGYLIIMLNLSVYCVLYALRAVR